MNIRTCPSCGQILPRRNNQKPQEPVAALGLVLEPAPPGPPDDPEFEDQYRRVLELQRVHTKAGTDLRPFWEPFVTSPRLLKIIDDSNRVADEVKGRDDLVAKRRTNIIRHVTGPDVAMPADYPTVPPGPKPANKEYRVFRLRDELEWLVIAFYLPSREFPYGRPVREILTHQLARAILDWKAAHLDLWLSTYPHLLGGRISHTIPPEARKILNDRAADRGRPFVRPRAFLHEVKFLTVAFMRWLYANLN